MITDVFISEGAQATVKEYIRQSITPAGGQLIEIMETDKTYDAVCSHADLYCCAIGDQILRGGPAGRLYPHNTGYNGVQLGSYFVHNLSITAPQVLSEVQRLGLTAVNVKQGYTKCNLVVVDDGLCGPGFLPLRRPAVITSDQGIAKALDPLPIDVLQITSGFVSLPGFPWGFLGGASGRIGRRLLFHGNLAAHPDFHRICTFLRWKNVEPIWFADFDLTDIGSIITLM